MAVKLPGKQEKHYKQVFVGEVHEQLKFDPNLNYFVKYINWQGFIPARNDVVWSYARLLLTSLENKTL